jgi:peptide-methionine (R)-S-oxide reductase
MQPKFTTDPEAIAKLTPEQYRVTQRGGTERPGMGEYLDNKEPGIYVDVVSGEPLFASSAKFNSGSGWPSFTKPIEPTNVKEIQDVSHGMVRTEVRSVYGDSHLGHVFPDGPRADGGMRIAENAPPEEALALGVLGQAAHDLRRFQRPAGKIDRELYRDAFDWINAHDTSWPYSFVNICKLLDIPPDALRAELLSHAALSSFRHWWRISARFGRSCRASLASAFTHARDRYRGAIAPQLIHS